MTDTQLLQEVLKSVQGLETRFDGLETRFDGLETRFDGLEKKVDHLSEELTNFKGNQEDFNTAMWSLSNQAFTAINDVKSEVVAPWKIRQSKIV